MTLVRTGDAKLIRELNTSIILDIIRKQGPISRAEISKVVKISPTTVASCINALMKDSLVMESGTGVSSGGRKPILVQLNPNDRFLIGVAVNASKITIAAFNLYANVQKKISHSLLNETYSDISDFMINLLQEFLEDFDQKENCLGISITFQGIVDADKGVVVYNPKLNMLNVSLKDKIEDALHIPTYIDNDTNGSLLAEKGYGHYQQAKNLIYVTIGDGVGASILVNDAIYRGHLGGAGEFGHTTINFNGPVCECGNIGCLENYVSWQTIHSRIEEELGHGRKSIMSEWLKENEQLTIEKFQQAVLQEDPLALSILDDVAFYLGIGLVSIINLFNPEKIIVGGELANNIPYFIRRLNEFVLSHSLETHTKEFAILPSSFGDDSEVIGAASILLDDLFHSTIR
ncbi:ROK family transcriptional regulator [Bacillus sp. SD088]|uniref:ROK family transcriptional regulator n=1 Tax=Bacillus sp. SD088 TaxID=2782012 RepID=UPI001F6055B1|nr:ROK family transcriptional regulator [Bacillus sp. SD088]